MVEAGYVALTAGPFSLVLVQAPAHLRATGPVERREDTPIKLVVDVPDLAACRALAPSHGAVVDPMDREWVWDGATVVDGHDPEGNVLQLRMNG